ncbi:hypothetical protein BRC89_12220 [Halobacteriales archaeon QS_4_70_19]|jgi:hypothetical protein|nr:MAG: hypothetical protein BRC89_12220 [Halobacteriales archaeon QS_4_70_19]
MSDETEVRDVLLEHSDQQPVRNVFQAITDDAEADLADHVEAMRATDGDIALVARDGAADIYARWSGSRFELLTVWPPWTVTGYDTTDRSGLEDQLTGLAGLRPMPHDDTPFASPETLTSLRGLVWP